MADPRGVRGVRTLQCVGAAGRTAAVAQSAARERELQHLNPLTRWLSTLGETPLTKAERRAYGLPDAPLARDKR